MPRERRENLGVGRTVPAQYSRQEDERAAAEAFNQAMGASGAADPHPSAPADAATFPQEGKATSSGAGAPPSPEGKASEGVQGATAKPPASIGQEELQKAIDKYSRYKAAKATLDERIVEDERWWKLRHWESIRRKVGEKEIEPLEPASAWLLNSLMNKHADFMDNYPTCSVLPRARDDIEDAKQLSEIVPVILEQCDFETVYNETRWTVLKTGTACVGVFWDSGKENGAGDISIQPVDILNLFWQPDVKDIQKSDAVFCVTVMSLEELRERWGDKVRDFQGGAGDKPREYIHDDNRDDGQQVTVIDWYYKKTLDTGRTVVHLCKFVGDVILFASENPPEDGAPDMRETGWYEDGEYPFVVEALYPIADSIAGFGEIDIMRDPQMYIDQMDSLILRNAMQSGHKRWFITDNGNVNAEEYADWNRDFVHVAGSVDEASIREIQIGGLDSSVYSMRQNKIDELKETSGNRDFSQGGTTSGITAASAIAALQEAGSKLSRDMIKNAYRMYTKVCMMVIERVRQFYDIPRTFRILGEQGQQEFIDYSNENIRPMSTGVEFGDEGSRRPVFDLKVKAEKQSPFSRISQNELAKELYGMGVFNPEMADQALMVLDMMQFEGIEQLKRKIQERGTVFEQMQQMIAMQQQQIAMLSGADPMAAAAAQAPEQEPGISEAGSVSGSVSRGDALGRAAAVDGNSLASQAANRARNVTAPR